MVLCRLTLCAMLGVAVLLVEGRTRASEDLLSEAKVELDCTGRRWVPSWLSCGRDRRLMDRFRVCGRSTCDEREKLRRCEANREDREGGGESVEEAGGVEDSEVGMGWSWCAGTSFERMGG